MEVEDVTLHLYEEGAWWRSASAATGLFLLNRHAHEAFSFSRSVKIVVASDSGTTSGTKTRADGRQVSFETTVQPSSATDQ